MKVDLNGLLRSNVGEVEIDVVASGSILGNPSVDVIRYDDVRLAGKLTNLAGFLTFDGCVKFGYEVKCSRCLKNVQKEHLVNVVENFSDTQPSEETLEYSYAGKEIDFTQFVVDEAILAIPARHLCNDECKGLCPMCGVELNEQQCSCKEENIDPRLSILGQLFK